MYPAQTSLIPVQISLVKFWEGGGNVFANYPYWYLGTTPYRYLTGPILPSVMMLCHHVFPTINLFETFFLLLPRKIFSLDKERDS
jgi:hypothetical protein